ncbi:MAG: hypothetical protein LBT56_04360 [Prevotellaceae bacterium]|jgi:hypothetical protein|nr:hypothetical protein [Prevotellaceae bacterium]
MKTIKLIQIIIFLSITLCSCDSCEKEYLTELPPETQTGANTFGCYVNGELFVAQREYGQLGRPYLSAGYSRLTTILGIGADGKNGHVGFSVFYPTENANITMSTAGCHTKDLWYGREPIGEVYLTKFDTINKIVSGKFSCKIKLYNSQNYDGSDTILDITQGRFDLKLEMLND